MNLRVTWWRHQMETFYALLTLCAGNSPAIGEFLAQRPMPRSFMFCLICVWNNSLVNNRDAGDLRRHHAHNDVIIMNCMIFSLFGKDYFKHFFTISVIIKTDLSINYSTLYIKKKTECKNRLTSFALWKHPLKILYQHLTHSLTLVLIRTLSVDKKNPQKKNT